MERLSHETPAYHLSRELGVSLQAALNRIEAERISREINEALAEWQRACEKGAVTVTSNKPWLTVWGKLIRVSGKADITLWFNAGCYILMDRRSGIECQVWKGTNETEADEKFFEREEEEGR